MDQAKRFFRYVMPGSLFLFFYYGFLYLFSVLDVICWDDIPGMFLFESQAVLESAKILLAVVAGIVASGVFGFLFGVIHHVFTNAWLCGCRVDHTDAVRIAFERRYLKAIVETHSSASTKHLSRDGAWRVLTSVWFSSVLSDPDVDLSRANEACIDMANQYHGSAANFWASVVALFAVSVQVYLLTGHLAPPSLGILALGLIPVGVLLANLHRLRNQYGGLVEHVFLSELAKKCDNGKNAYPVMIRPIDCR